MARIWRAIAGLALVALVGCGTPMSAGNEEAMAQGALIEPTVVPTATQSPTPTIASISTVTPTRIPTTATIAPTATVPMHPNGRMPADWRIYAGTSVPVSFFYQVDWTLQRQAVHDEYMVIAVSPDGRSIFAVGPHGDLDEALPELLAMSDDEIEERFLADQLDDDDGMFAGFCDGAVKSEGVSRTTIVESEFLTLNVRCSIQETPSRLRVSLGMAHARAWMVLTAAPVAGYAEFEKTYFGPMVASLKFD